MAFRKTLNIVLVSLLAGCAGQAGNLEKKQNMYPCDSLLQRFPEDVRHLVKDGCYDIGNKRIYKKGNMCYEAVKDTLIMKYKDSTITQEYWK
jgi:hypothetical protein